jgi:ribosomal protein S18 acetylase RimI-like enzyme
MPDHPDLPDLPGLLARMNEYLHRVPLSGAEPEQVGPFTLFRPTGTISYYARPRAGQPVTPADVKGLAGRCAELGLPLSVEWVVECCPSLGEAARAAGLAVTEHPLLALLPGAPAAAPAPPAGATLRRVPAEPGRVLAARAVASVAFRAPGTAAGSGGVPARQQAERSFAADRLGDLVGRVASGVTVMVEASDPTGEVVASGQCQPAGDAAEIVGVATLPAYRRQGYAAAITAELVRAARAGGAELVLLSAQDDAVARVYEHVGFVRAGRAGAAEPEDQ